MIMAPGTGICCGAIGVVGAVIIKIFRGMNRKPKRRCAVLLRRRLVRQAPHRAVTPLRDDPGPAVFL